MLLLRHVFHCIDGIAHLHDANLACHRRGGQLRLGLSLHTSYALHVTCTATCVDSLLMLLQKLHCLLLMLAHLSLLVHTERCQSFQTAAMYQCLHWSCPPALELCGLVKCCVLCSYGTSERQHKQLVKLEMAVNSASSSSRCCCIPAHVATLCCCAVKLSSLHNPRTCRGGLVMYICIDIHNWHLLSGHVFHTVTSM